MKKVLVIIMLLFSVSYAMDDPNCSGSYNITDAMFIINYIFNGGPAPVKCNTADSTVILYWTFPPTPVKAYEIRWAWSLEDILQWDSAGIVGIIDTIKSYPNQKKLMPVYGIIPESTYYFAIKVCDSANHWSEISNIAIER
jgi:hypothetical protein